MIHNHITAFSSPLKFGKWPGPQPAINNVGGASGQVTDGTGGTPSSNFAATANQSIPAGGGTVTFATVNNNFSTIAVQYNKLQTDYAVLLNAFNVLLTELRAANVIT